MRSSGTDTTHSLQLFDPTGSRLFCYRCGCYWKTRSAELPKTCPRCGSSRWNDPVRREASCRFCGTMWTMRSIDEPCPSCGHTIFEAPDRSHHHCNRCNHEWHPRADSRPRRCPLCKSTKWDAPTPVRHTCRMCGNVWVGREKRPKRCPSCKSEIWNKSLTRAQCKACGHQWTVKGGKAPEQVSRCPSCRSSAWKVSPIIVRCHACGFIRIPRYGTQSACRRCKKHPEPSTAVCGFCGTDADMSYGVGICRRCGRHTGSGADSHIDLWSDGVQTLRYAYMDGFAFVYLWEKGRPIATAYFHDVCSRFRKTPQRFVDDMNSGSMHAGFRALARDMKVHRFDCLSKVDYFIKRFGLSHEDAIILAIHFTGMCPEAIALSLNRSHDEILLAFDRIANAYIDSGIAVDDGVFTDDPFQFY